MKRFGLQVETEIGDVVVQRNGIVLTRVEAPARLDPEQKEGIEPAACGGGGYMGFWVRGVTPEDVGRKVRITVVVEPIDG